MSNKACKLQQLILTNSFRYVARTGKEKCLEAWSKNGERAYTLFLFSIQYMIPLSLIVVLYSKAWNAIRKQNKIIISMQEMQQKGARHYSRSQSWDHSMTTSRSPLESTGRKEDKLFLVFLLSGCFLSVAQNRHENIAITDERGLHGQRNSFCLLLLLWT